MYVLLNSVDAKSNSGDVAANNTSLDPSSAALIAALRNRAKVSILQMGNAEQGYTDTSDQISLHNHQDNCTSRIFKSHFPYKFLT